MTTRIFLGLGLLCLPLAGIPAASEVAAKQVADVADFGAIPDDGKDDTEAMRKAIDSCSGKANVRLLLHAGTYDFTSPADRPDRRKFRFADLKGLEVDGQGALLLFADRANPFSFMRCEDLTLRNLTVDWSRPPFSQGTITSAGEDFLEVQVDDAYPMDKTVKIAAFMDFDPATRLPLANMDVFGSAIMKTELTAPQKLRLTLKKSGDPEKNAHFAKYLPASIGHLLVLRHEVYGSHVFDLLRCRNVLLENINIYASPGMGIHASLCDTITSRHVSIRTKPESGRLMSTTADCQYYTHCMGTITIEDGYYEGMGDDGLNVTAKYREVTSVTSQTSFVMALPTKRGWAGTPPEAGEKLYFADARDLAPKGAAVVRGSRFDAESGLFTVDVDALPAGVGEKDLVSTAKYLPKVVVRRSTFRGMRSRAMLFSTTDVLVEDCRVEGTGYPGILLKGGLRHGCEGPAPSNVTIRNSVFEGCGGAAIYAYTDGPDRSPLAISRLTIEGNTFRESPGLFAQRFKKERPTWMHWAAGLCVLSANEVSVRKNRFEGYSTAMYLRQVNNCVVDGNTSTEPARILVSSESAGQVRLEDDAKLELATAGADIEPDLRYVLDFR
jgi:hypothetical protein